MTVYNFAHSVKIDGMYYKTIVVNIADNLDCEIINPSSNIDHHNNAYTILFITTMYSQSSQIIQ